MIKKKIKLTESQFKRVLGQMIKEHDDFMDNPYGQEYDGGNDESIVDRLMRKLQGVSKEQAEYNREHNLPKNWRGSAEGYHEYITNKKFPSGSN